ncbi:MAG: HAMP domain-containing protein [Deltaproteobacteria bacterium]|nr:HAMP domain-containing protein [Deltaproteobacteria bacterium]
MELYEEARKADLLRRRRERYIIIALMILIPLLTTYLLSTIFDFGLGLPRSNSILIFALINLNVILLLLLLYLTVRNLVKLIFERKKGIMGARLRTKLVMAFVTLSLVPTIILFFVSVQFIATSIEYWFNLPIEKSLKNSLEVGQDFYEEVADEIIVFGNNLSRLITYHGYMLKSRKEEVEKFIAEKRLEYSLASVKLFSKRMALRAVSQDDGIDLSPFKNPSEEILRKSFEKGTDIRDIQSSAHGDLVVGIVPVFSRTESKAVVGLIVFEKFIPGAFVNKLNTLARGLEEYKQFKMLKKPIKFTHIIILSIVTLLIIFSSVWFGFYLSKGITIPIQELAEGTKRIAAGDYDFHIDLEARDEIGVLVNSFNRMTADLRQSKARLEEANRELIKSNLELEQRRLYMETVLANVAAGVVSADARGIITTIKKKKKKMLSVDGKKIIGRYYKDFIGKEHIKMIRQFLGDRSLSMKGAMRRQVRLSVSNKTLTLLVSLNILRDERGRYLGLVAVLEDLTEMERAQRMAAWREVARRIAHEVKNPLTPIQLSAQRLKRKYRDKIGKHDGKVFDECTDMIISQVEELKHLVNEFSSFARMPASNPRPNDINRIIEEAVSLYREARKGVKVVFRRPAEALLIEVDREQVKRAVINILDNAVDAVDGDGEVVVDLAHDKDVDVVRISITDNGKGISPDHKDRLFEPYFSTKKQGTGLGLAIVSTIVSEHKGNIKVEDIQPKGTRFTIELPAGVTRKRFV